MFGCVTPPIKKLREKSLHQENNMNLKHIKIACCLAALGAISTANADTLWFTNPDMPTVYSANLIGPSAKTPMSESEVADDFNVIGLIEQVIADGEDCNSCYSGQPVTGVYVRFYEWTESGPGELQSEQFLAADDPNFVWTPGMGPEFLQITLPEPFQATGWHFVSVQVTFSTLNSGTGKWHFHPVNYGSPMGAPSYFRNLSAGGQWVGWHTVIGSTPRDASFKLVGVPGGLPPMDVLAATSDPITPSARLRITGDGFGETQGGGQVLINNVQAIVTQWSNGQIVAYVPEQTAIGQAELVVENDAGQTDGMNIEVQPRESDGNVKWRFAVDADLMFHGASVAPDGSIYVNDYNNARLYKLSPDGGLLWTVDALRGQVGDGAEGPIVVRDDGTVILGVNPLGPKVEIVAYSPDGELQWVFTNPFSISLIAGPALGPDGNIYAVFNIPQPGEMAAVSLTPQGGLRWSNSGEPFLYQEAGQGAQLRFTSSEGFGGPIDEMVVHVDHNLNSRLHAFDLETGEQNFSVPFSTLGQVGAEVPTGQNGAIYLPEFAAMGPGWGLQQFDPADGSRTWRFEPNEGIASGLSTPTIGPDGTIYFTWDMTRLTAVTPDAQELWTYVSPDGFVSKPTLSPDNDTILFSGGWFGQNGFIRAIDRQTQEELFQINLQSNAGVVSAGSPNAFSPDGATAYAQATIVNDIGNEHCYVYAISIGDEVPQPILADLNGDGAVGVPDLMQLLSTWGQCAPSEPCAADLNGDGSVGVADLISLLADWS